jgi:esterase/lipase superfamily enzyme
MLVRFLIGFTREVKRLSSLEIVRQTQRIVILGHSLGTGVGAQLVRQLEHDSNTLISNLFQESTLVVSL